MLDVAKKPTKSVPPAEPVDDQPALSFPLRFPEKYAWVIAALDRHAEDTDQSRNMAIVLLLRDAMVAAGFKPE